MKPIRCLFRNSAIAILSVSALSCVDNAYDLSNLSSEAQLFKNSLSAPVGTATIHLDSVIGGMDVDSSILKYKNGMYVFGYSGNFDLGNLTKEINTFKLSKINDIESPIYLYDGTNFPGPVPFPLPATEAKSYYGDMSITLPTGFGSTSLIDIDSVSLINTHLKISAECFGLTGGNGKTLGDNMSITFTAIGNAADYYVDGHKTNTWTLRFGESSDIEIRKIRLINGNNKLDISRDVKIEIVNIGDVMVTQKMKTYMNFKMEFTNGIDYDLIWGRVNYSLPQTQISPIHFEGLGKVINGNNVLSLYNPTITLSTTGNIGVPIDLTLDMSTSNSKTGVTSTSLTDPTFHILPARDTLDMKTNTKIIDRTNGTSDLFNINPDIIRLGYNAQTVKNSPQNHFIAKNAKLNMSYKMEIPLQFGGDLNISIDTTLENPFADKLDKLENQKDLSLALTLNVKNRIPLTMQIKLDALDSNFNNLFSVHTSTIDAAETTAGIATGLKETITDVTLTPDQINKIKDTKMFRVSFVITGKQNEAYVSVQPSDYITIKIGGKMNGGVLIDLSSNSK